MKKLICTILIMTMILSCGITAFAFEWDKMSVEEIQTEIDRAKAELTTREIKSIDDNPIIVDADGLVITITGAEVYKNYDGSIALRLKYTAVNNSSTSIAVIMDTTYINGWEENNLFYEALGPGKKVKNEIVYYEIDQSSDVYCYEDLETVEIYLHTFGPDTYKTIADNIVATIYFK